MKMKTKTFILLLCLLIAGSAVYGQKSSKKSNKKISVSGYVVDQTQKPVANANVLIDGEKTAVLTDIKGFFKVKIKPDVEKIGILTSTNGIMEEAVNGRTRINFTFAGLVGDQVSNQPLDEEVNVGYTKVRKKSLTGPVNSLDVNKSRYASYNSIYDVLRGEVPGVQVTGNSIRIQGASSLTLSTEPLFVVDGVPVNSVDGIQPIMVKSIQVLKGSSASIYGSRGANGVILINLLKGDDK